MRVVRSTLTALVLVFCPAFVMQGGAQETGSVTGLVTNAETQEPLTGVQVLVVGTNRGSITNAEGNYLIVGVPSGTQQIRALSLGFSQVTTTATVTAGSSTSVDFELTPSAVELEAVVVNAVTGQEQRAREMGASIGTIELDNLNPAPITSFADALSGRTEGVILQDVNGTTGTGQRIRIRGANSLSLSNEPLIFIDGIQLNNNFGGTFGVGGQEASRLSDLNPNNIATIEVIKGPAASALYGTAAANGVILITTKRGTPGETHWSAWVETGQIDDETDYPANFGAFQINDPNAPMFTDAGLLNTGGDDPALSYCPNRLAAVGDCTQDGTLRFNTLLDGRTNPFVSGSRGRYGASVRGGSREVQYFVSGQYEDEGGVIEMNTMEKVNLRANLDAAISESVNLGVSFGYVASQTALNNNDNSIFSPILNGLVGLPYFVPADTTREFGAPVNDANYGFGFNMEELNFLPTTGEIDRYITSGKLRWRPTTWLTFNLNGGLDLTTNHAFETLQPDRLPIAVSYANGYRQSERENTSLYSGSASGVAVFQPTNSLLSTTTVGTSYSKDKSENTFCFGSSLVPGTGSCATVAALFDIDEDFFEVRTIGGYIQQELAWRDRVFVAAGLRADDNSTFGVESEIAYYPSASLSWVIAEEEWFPQLDFLSTLRLRTAWGVSGLRPSFRDAITLFQPTTVARPAGDVPGISLDVFGNAQLKPERSSEWEGGFDTGLFEDRVSLTFTYFYKESEDALIERDLPGSLGLTTSFFDNLGSIKNSGTEVALDVLVYESQDFGLNLSFTNTTLDNEVLELGTGIEDIVFNRGLQRHREGLPAGAFFLPRVSWDDADGNGLLDLNEVFVDTTEANQFIGPSLPTWQRSVSGVVRMFDWLTVSTLFEGRGGNFTGNDSEAFRCGFRSTFGCPAVGNPDADLQEQAAYIADRYGGLVGPDNTSRLASAAGYVEEADFYKWRELAISVLPPAGVAERFPSLSGLRLTLAGRNLATFTDYDGLDPETVEGGGDANFSQSEFNTQPPVRYLMLRLDYSF